jgi:hypothetical protein
VAGGNLPPDSTTSSGSSGPTFSDVGGSGLALGLDAGVRLVRHLYLGLTLEHVEYPSVTSTAQTQTKANTTFLGLVVGFIGNPDRVSFYIDLAVGARWYHYATTDTALLVTLTDNTYSSGEAALGLGVWVPVGGFLRFLPKVSVGGGSFSPDGSASGAEAHSFVMLGVAGFYNANF